MIRLRGDILANCLTDYELESLLGQTGSVAQLTQWRKHMRMCDDCAGRMAQTKRHLATVNDYEKTDDDSDGDEVASFFFHHASLEPNVRLGDFKVIKRIGAGGMGVVYQAQQVSLNRRVALKVLPVGLADDHRAVDRFHREAKAAAKLQHTNVVAVYAEGVEQGVCYYAMELVEGKGLNELIGEMKRENVYHSLTLDEVIDERRLNKQPKQPFIKKEHLNTHTFTQNKSDIEYFDQVARRIGEIGSALHYAHQQGVIHRDVKPANLFLSVDGQLKLMDLALRVW